MREKMREFIFCGFFMFTMIWALLNITSEISWRYLFSWLLLSAAVSIDELFIRIFYTREERDEMDINLRCCHRLRMKPCLMFGNAVRWVIYFFGSLFYWLGFLGFSYITNGTSEFHFVLIRIGFLQQLCTIFYLFGWIFLIIKEDV